MTYYVKDTGDYGVIISDNLDNGEVLGRFDSRNAAAKFASELIKTRRRLRTAKDVGVAFALVAVLLMLVFLGAK